MIVVNGVDRVVKVVVAVVAMALEVVDVDDNNICKNDALSGIRW